jgi:integrase
VQHFHQVLNTMLNAAVRSGMIPNNPSEGAGVPKRPHREMLFLSPAEVEQLADAIEAPYRPWVFLMAYGGLRWGESAALRRGRIDILHSRIEVAEATSEVRGKVIFGETKNRKRRSIPLPTFLRDMLHEHLLSVAEPGANALVFTTPGGHVLRNSNFRPKVWRDALARAGLPPGLRIHDLRHTCVALLISQGAHPEAIKRHLGHSSISVTMDRYGHVFPSEADGLAAALDGIRSGTTPESRLSGAGTP